jgi:TRAP transporter 4TM/12TM fusion protein
MSKIINTVASIVALIMVLYHLVYTVYSLQGPIYHVNSHLMFSLLVVFLVSAGQARKAISKFILLYAALLSVAGTTYLHIYYEDLNMRSFFNTGLDLAVGVTLLVLAVEASRRAFDWLIPGIVIVSVIYPFLGRYLPEPFHTTSYALDQVIANLALSFNNGLYGAALYTSANYIFLFIVFGAVLQACGGTKFFIELGKLAGKHLKGGPAMMSVIGSAGVGSLTGSVVANMSITGSFTIPLMKSVGYKPHQAGAIEAAASNGGQILPPVMGVTAFFMAGLTGIPYIQICAMALIPALLYYLNIGVYVQLQAARLGIKISKTDADLTILFTYLPLVVIPFTVIIFLLIKGYSVMFVAFWAIVSGISCSLLQKKTRPSFRTFVSGLIEGGKSGAQIGVMTAAIGLLLTTFTMTGLGVKIGAGIEHWSGGNIALAMIIIWILAIIMGMVGIGLVAYLIVSMFVITGLERVGIPFETAHFFILFPCVFGGLTPPVALFALVASKLAESDYLKTAIEAAKMASLGLILPFMFVTTPALLLKPRGAADMFFTLIAATVLIFSGQIAFSGFWLSPVSIGKRLIFVTIAVACLAFFVWKDISLAIGATILFVIMLIYDAYRARAQRVTVGVVI